MSLLYFLAYVSAAGGLDSLLSSCKKSAGQQFRVVVWFFVRAVELVVVVVVFFWHSIKDLLN